jgi:hypothetical protein
VRGSGVEENGREAIGASVDMRRDARGTFPQMYKSKRGVCFGTASKK